MRQFLACQWHRMKSKGTQQHHIWVHCSKRVRMLTSHFCPGPTLRPAWRWWEGWETLVTLVIGTIATTSSHACLCHLRRPILVSTQQPWCSPIATWGLGQAESMWLGLWKVESSTLIQWWPTWHCHSVAAGNCKKTFKCNEKVTKLMRMTLPGSRHSSIRVMVEKVILRVMVRTFWSEASLISLMLWQRRQSVHHRVWSFCWRSSQCYTGPTQACRPQFAHRYKLLCWELHRS